MSDKKQILIIGGSSFVAKNFIRLHQEDYDIKTISRSKTGFTNEVCYSDFFNIGEEEFKGVSIVINCAAIVHQQKKIADKVYNNINFELAIKLAEKAKKSNVKTFIQLSTIAVYGKQTHITENTIEKPITPYGKSKLLADKDLITMIEEQFKVVVVRPPMIYGGEGTPGNMMRLIKLIAKGFPLPFKAVSNKRDFIHINNLIGFINASFRNNLSGTFLVSDDNPVSVYELYKTVVTCLGKSNKAFKVPNFCYKLIQKMAPGVYDKLFGSLTINIDSTLILINWKPVNLFEKGISEMVLDLKNNKK